MSPDPATSTGTAPATGPRPGPAPATAPGTATDRACDRCVARSWLLARLSAHLELARGQVEPVLGLDDEELLAALGGKRRAAIWSERQRLDLRQERRHAASAGLELICRCDQSYPARLACSPSPPAVLHVAGGLERFLKLVAGDPVAIVGARTPSAYGLEMATLLGRGLGRAGLTVISGMALGIDSAAQAGALAGEGGTVAVLPGGADQPYPVSKRLLHRQIQGAGAAVSELPPGAVVRRWCFPARNRIVAGLSAMTVVVEAGEGSGAPHRCFFAGTRAADRGRSGARHLPARRGLQPPLGDRRPARQPPTGRARSAVRRRRARCRGEGQAGATAGAQTGAQRDRGRRGHDGGAVAGRARGRAGISRSGGAGTGRLRTA